MALVDTCVTTAADHNASVELFFGVVATKPGPTMHFPRDEVVKGQWHLSPTACAESLCVLISSVTSAIGCWQ